MQNKTVLVVDDDAPTRKEYASYLVGCGYEVFEAEHGGEAILHVHRYRPDVVVMDIDMPVLDGVETAESLRGCPTTARTPILAVTDEASPGDQERMRALCDDFLFKPCAPDVIASRIRSLVRGDPDASVRSRPPAWG